MKKTLPLAFSLAVLLLVPAVSQSYDEDDLFGDESDSIDEWQSPSEEEDSSDLSKGIIFKTGSVTVGGSLTSKAQTSTTIISDEDDTFKDRVYNTSLTPTLEGTLTVDARPKDNLRIYTKIGADYPFTTSSSTASLFNSSTSSSWFTMDEMFTDFSIKDKVFFRFGKHTVTWGTGYFFSPVSDIINTSSIDVENPDDSVSGCLNLRTQIVLPGIHNYLWLYVIPSTDFTTSYSAASYARDTGLAAKGEVLLGNWEVGLGAYYRYLNPPKVMITATGDIFKASFFGEAVYQYGSENQWNNDTSWKDKESVFKITGGINYYWSQSKITLALQYYYDSDKDDYQTKVDTAANYVNLAYAQSKGAYSYKTLLTNVALVNYSSFYSGHNIAGLVNFGRVGTSDLTASVYGILHIGTLPSSLDATLKSANIDTDILGYALASASLTYSPIDQLSISAGPYMTWTSFNNNPIVSFNMTLTLGGGNY